MNGTPEADTWTNGVGNVPARPWAEAMSQQSRSIVEIALTGYRKHTDHAVQHANRSSFFDGVHPNAMAAKCVNRCEGRV
jgi:hypothetical protein